MTDSIKATRRTVPFGDRTIDGFMLPDGNYRMSQTQAAECVGKPEINARRFLGSKAIESLLGQGYTPDSIEIDSPGQIRGQSRFNALPLEVVTAYWFYQATQGNQTALSLVWALLTESLERRFDGAFGVTRTEEERNDRLAQRVSELEQSLEILGQEFGKEDMIRWERDEFARLLRENGIDPYGVPGVEDDNDPKS